MKKIRFKALLSMVIAISFMLVATSMCYAAEEYASPTSLVDEVGHPLPMMPEVTEEGIVPYEGVIYGPITGTTTGYLNGRFTVPNDSSGHLIRIHFLARPLEGANGAAVFRLVVSGNGLSNTVYMPATHSLTPYSIGNLPAGTYSYAISPHSNVSGTYAYGLQFYSY